MRAARIVSAVLLLLVACGGDVAGVDAPSPSRGSAASDAAAASPAPGPGPGQGTDAGADSPSPSPGGETERTVRLMHWNIAGGKENACQGPGIARAVRRFVNAHGIDFVGLNEVCQGAQFEAIRDALRDEWGIANGAKFAEFVGDGTNRLVGNAILSRSGIDDVSTQKVGADQYGDRNLLCGRVPKDERLRFCSVHLTPADAAAANQMGKVLDIIESWWRDRKDTVLLTGDLNLAANHAALDTVYAATVDTPNNGNNKGQYREVDDADPAHCKGFGERSLPGTAGGPCSEGGKIDFIFVRENRIVDGDYDGDTLDIPQDCTGACSDHRVVIGRVKVRVAR